MTASATSLLAFVAACVIVEITPGPNMAYLAALSLSRGAAVGLAAVAGVALGLSVYGLAAAFGVAAVIENSTFLYETLRWAGVIYLLWIAWEAWATAGEVAPEETRVENQALASAFRRGLVTNLLNPKAAVFYVAMLPEFVNVPAGNITGQTLKLSAIYVGIATAIHALIVLSAGFVGRYVEVQRRIRLIRRALALALVGVAVWLALSTAR